MSRPQKKVSSMETLEAQFLDRSPVTRRWERNSRAPERAKIASTWCDRAAMREDRTLTIRIEGKAGLANSSHLATGGGQEVISNDLFSQGVAGRKSYRR